MENTKKYEYILNQSEIMEFCFYALLEQSKCKKRTWLYLLLICILQLVLMPLAAAWTVIVIVVVMAIFAVHTYMHIKKSVSGKRWTVCLEDGMLKVDREGSSEVPCSGIQMIRTTRRLLMLGYLQTAQQPAWFIMPLRAFADVQERERFLDRLRHPQETQGWAGNAVDKKIADKEAIDKGSASVQFAYVLDDKKWVYFRKDAAAVIKSGTLGKAEWIRAIFIRSCLAAVVMLSCIYLTAGHFNWMLAGYGLGIALLLTLRLFRDPGKALWKQIQTPAVQDRECGVWRVTLSEAGVLVDFPINAHDYYPWEVFGWLVETQDAFYIFHKDKKHFVMIAKESFQDWNQVAFMRELCARKGLKSLQGQKMHYLQDWQYVLLVVFCLMLCIVLLVAGIFRGLLRETRSRPGTGDELAQYGYEHRKDFDPAEYPDYVPLDTQAEVLESFGFQVPEETVESVRAFMTEYNMREMVEGYPYTYLLLNLGRPQYDEDWTVTEYPQDVFWFDFEGMDIGTDYIDVLNGMLALAKGSCLDSVSGITEDTAGVDWERGKGTITLSLEWEGQTYQWDMDMRHDWIDSEVLGVLNALLIEGKSDKLFYVAGDNGQGVLVFFCTAEWAQAFREATGLELVHYTAWTDEQKERAKH